MLTKKSMFLAALLLAGIVIPLRADGILPGSPFNSDPFTLNFDENGNGSISINRGEFTPLQGTLAMDPSNGGIFALTYTLPPGQTPVVNGDVLVMEPFGAGMSDVIRFTDAAGRLTGITADRMIYYSDTAEANEFTGDLADTGFPTNVGAGLTNIEEEVGAEGDNHFTHQALGNIYNGISDAPVPEPASLILMGSGLIWVWGIRHRRWRA